MIRRVWQRGLSTGCAQRDHKTDGKPHADLTVVSGVGIAWCVWRQSADFAAFATECVRSAGDTHGLGRGRCIEY